MAGLRKEYPNENLDTLCGLFGKSRQAYYKNKKSLVSFALIRATLLEAISYYRSKAPNMGGVKLYHELRRIYGHELVGGRDAFMKFLRSEKLMLSPHKPRHTTNSHHPYHKYPNLIKDIQAEYPNHIWVSDITYIWIEGGVCYLHLITDVYSHAVIGWILAPGLHAEYTAEALKQAIILANSENLCGTIHHSDRGVQYACHMYVGILMSHHIRISMTEISQPTDNAMAERMNGILKTEWIYGRSLFRNEEEARREIAKMIDFYNNERPHMSIGMKKPMDVYSGETPGRNLWKKTKKGKLPDEDK